MKNSCKIIISGLLFIALVSCEKEVTNVKYPEFTPKWAISAYLSPDNLMNRIILNQNMPNFGAIRWGESMGKPEVSLSDGSQFIILDSIQLRNGIKRSDFPIKEGTKYTLKIKSDKGYNAEASCIVPYKSDFNPEIDTTRSVFLIDSKRYFSIHPEFSFTDAAGAENFYLIFCETVRFGKAYGNLPLTEAHRIEKPYFTDKGKDGTRIRLSLDKVGSGMEDSSFLKLYLLNINKEYYDLLISLDNYKSGEDPFSEPSPVYTNIKGGVGIFAAFTVDSLIFRIK